MAVGMGLSEAFLLPAEAACELHEAKFFKNFVNKIMWGSSAAPGGTRYANEWGPDECPPRMNFTSIMAFL